MAVEIVFETHSTSEDNELGIATGWHPGVLSAQGRKQAKQLGDRRRDDGLAAIFTSDLQRAVETSNIAFKGSKLPVFLDWRLRECNYGTMNGQPAEHVHADRGAWIDKPYPAGESWAQAVQRVEAALTDIRNLFDGNRVLIIAHIATRWGLERAANGKSLQELAADEFRSIGSAKCRPGVRSERARCRWWRAS